jgi:hypothetical protein
MNEPAESRDQESEPNGDGAERMKHLLQSTLPAIGDDANLDRDLWPAMLRRMDEQSARRRFDSMV